MSRATSSAGRKGAASKTTKSSAVHPTWVEMIKECITIHPEDARAGVSRPAIKKFVETKYKIGMTASAMSQLSRAIVSGSEKGTFVLPKGPSGKVKLAPKAKIEAIKENNKIDEEKKVGKAAKKATSKTSKASKSSSSAKENKRPAAKAANGKSQASKKGEMKAQPKTVKKIAGHKPVKKASAKSYATKKLATTKAKPAARKPSSRKTDTKRIAAKTAASKPKKSASKASASKGRPASKTAASKKPASTKSAKPASKVAKTATAAKA